MLAEIRAELDELENEEDCFSREEDLDLESAEEQAMMNDIEREIEETEVADTFY